ncbi:hypothetical protein [Variovorax sp. PAMC 28711]|uniref:hypothetical protein n=1 Tax=Variovorax sp. PAMC 28711 TaxID=1795631 RepID=UPI00078BFC81|nr:hypothetical protein [Variovorax sp. PAMC 28711]AMM23170.1 hypothetical protein AX767_01365 [Variovorax sp. PAMC 28711]
MQQARFGGPFPSKEKNMLIKFNKPDPRAGTVVLMDSFRGQHFIDSGAAVAVKEDSADSEAAAPAAAPAPAAKTVKKAKQ